MKKLTAIVLIFSLVVSFLGVSVASNEARANGPWPYCIIDVGDNCTTYYTATNNVDLKIQWRENDGRAEDQITTFVNSCNVSTAWGGDNITVSLNPGYYEITFRSEFSGIGPQSDPAYNIIPMAYTGNYIWPCIQPWLPPQPIEVGGEVYPVTKLNILAPWMALAAALIIGTAVVVRRRRVPS